MKKTLAIILSVLMIVCMMPSMAFAETNLTDSTVVITLEKESYTYAGKQIKPQVASVVYKENAQANGIKLNPNDDYTVSYGDNLNAGDATGSVIITGKGNYSGSVTKTFKIEKAPLASATYDPIYVSTAAEDTVIKSKIHLYYGESEITNTAESVFSIGNIVEHNQSSVYEIILTAKADSNFTGEKTIKFTTGVDINDESKFEIKTSLQTFTYNGSKQEYTTVDVYDKTNKKNLDRSSFKPTYKNNKDALNEKNQNAPTLVVEGVDGYIGQLEKKFTIEQFNLGKDAGLTIENLGKVGANTEPKPNVYLHGKLLVENVDIKYEYATIAEGKIRVTISPAMGNTNFTGSKAVEFNTGTDISNAQVTLDGAYTNTDGTYPKYIYDGSAHRPTVAVKLGSTTLKPYSDYTVSYVNDINASTSSTVSSKRAKVIITGTGTYAGKIERYYTIEQKSITNLRLSMSSNMAYIPVSNTTKYMPSFTFYDTNGRALILGTDYDVSSYSYVNDTTKSAVNITLVGKGNYSGYYYGFNVVLNGTSMANCRVELSQNSYKYTGYAHTPTVKVYNGSTLVPSTYYIVSYKNNKDAGTASVTVTGTNGYTGSQTVYFTITGNTINTCTATLSQTTYKYDGLYKEPTVIVKDGYTTLTRNVDYKLTYSNNRAAGTATVLITGIGKYSGSMTKEFTIQGIDQTVKTKYTKYTRYPTSSNFRIAATADGDGTGFTYTSSDPSVAKVSSDGEVEIIGTGIAKITVATKGTTRYNPASKVITVTVKPNKPVIKVTSPSEGEVKVLITKVKGATKYQVRYGRNDKYYNKYITHKENEYTKTSTTIKNRKSGVYYYVQVRAYKTLENGDKVWGNWTTLRKVRAK